MKTRFTRGPVAPLPIIGYRKSGAPIYPIAGGDGTGTGNPVLDRLVEERAKQVELMDGLLQRVQEEKRDLVDAEKSNLTAIKERLTELDEQIKPLQEFEELRGAGVQAVRNHPTPSAEQRGEQRGGMGFQVSGRGEYDYRSGGEILADACRVAWGQRDHEAASTRLESIGARVENGALVRAAAPHTTTAEVPGVLTTKVVGGIMSDIDAARPFISSLGAKDLGGIEGETFKRPFVSQHVEVGKQSAQKAEVPDGQFKIGSVPFTKDTYGGWTNVSRQLLDWTSPAVWDALLTDFQEIYGLETEEDAVAAFAASVTAATDTETEGATATVQERLTALYQAAALAYGGAKRLPNHIWMSLDEWATWGPMIDHLQATTAGNGGGSSSITSFAGQLLQTPRTVVPSLPAGTTIVGVKEKFEVYEDRFGFLSAVQPKVFGVELAYGGYMASGNLKPGGFAKVTFEPAGA